MIQDTRRACTVRFYFECGAEQGRVTWGRAAAIKAFQIKNYHMEEGVYMELNGKNERKEQAQILGRVFAVLEAIAGNVCEWQAEHDDS